MMIILNLHNIFKTIIWLSQKVLHQFRHNTITLDVFVQGMNLTNHTVFCEMPNLPNTIRVLLDEFASTVWCSDSKSMPNLPNSYSSGDIS